MTTGVIHSKIAGVAAKNPNGGSRQNYILAFCKPGTPLILKREPDNVYDKNAIGVWIKATAFFFFTSEVQIGFISAELAGELARHIDNGGYVSGHILNVTGGTENKTSLGVNIQLTKN